MIYYDLNPIFNSTLSLYSYNKIPNDTVRVSNELLSALSGIFTQIKNGNVKTYVQILHKNIYDYVDEMNRLIVNMLNNLNALTNTLISKNNTFTAITNYYLNNTSVSYINIIQSMKDIINNYFINEYNIIYPKIENLMNSFNKTSYDVLKKNLSYIENLYNNLLNGSYTINNITDQEFQKVLSNLENSYKYPRDIIDKINNYILEMSEIKETGFFNTKEEINNFNKTFISIFQKSEDVAKKLDDIQIIDKVFDEIMMKFRDSYINTVSYMEQIKSGNFSLEEDVLNKSSFNQEIKSQMEKEIKSISDLILDKIKINNNIEKIKNYLDSFLSQNLNEINILILNIDLIFSEEHLKSLADDFEISLNLSLEKITNETKNNINLIKNYYDDFYDIINDDKSLKKLVQKIMIAHPENQNYKGWDIIQAIDYDEIENKEYTASYLFKYNSFMENLDYSQSYLNNQLYFGIANEHREIYGKLKEYLQSILEHKLNEKFSSFDEIEFYNKHIKIIDQLNARLNKYFSQDYFNRQYLKIINESINLNKQLINEAKDYINTKHKFIKSLYFYNDDYSNDACIVFKRKVCYGCPNCVAYTFFYERKCFIIFPYQNNYLEVKKIGFETMKNLNEFKSSFNKFDDLLKDEIKKYNSILNSFSISINYISDEETIKNISINNFEPLKKWINDTLIKKYEDELIKSAYNYYQKNIEGKIEIIFGDIFNRWNDIFTNFEEDVKNNKRKIKYSSFELSMIANIYRAIIQAELTENYFNSIILFQKSEFDYTISYYYKYLMKLINKSFKYIINKIQKVKYESDDAFKQIKEEIKSIYDILTRDLPYSEMNCLSDERQLNILQVNESDFFKVKYIMEDNIKETDKKLDKIVYNIYEIEWEIEKGDEYALTMRFYLENKMFGKFIETYYKPIDKGKFFDLNLNKFKDIMKESWVFDEGDFIYIINNALFETNKVIKKELSIKLDNYSDII